MDGFVRSIHPQGSQEWFEERLGKFTSSEVFKLMKGGRRNLTEAELALRVKGDTRKTEDLLFGDGAMTYIYEKLNEILTGQVENNARGDAIDWGLAHEPDAVEFYNRIKKVRIEDVGFVKYNDFFGGSPDGIVTPYADNSENHVTEGIIEIKCPYKGANHMKLFNIDSQDKFKQEYEQYYAQMQGNILATNAQWCDFISYDPRPKIEFFQIKILRIYRDEPFVKDLAYRIDQAGIILMDLLENMIESTKIYTAA